MKKLNYGKIAKYGCLLVLVFVIYKCATSDPVGEAKEKSAKMKEAHCKIDWSKLDTKQKEVVLNEYIEDSSFLVDSPTDMLKYLLKESVQYPRTIEDDYGRGQIKDIDKGIIEYQSSFTSENKLGMKVKGHYWFVIKYTAGCKPFQYVSFDIE